MGNKGTLDLQTLPRFGDEPGLLEGEAIGRRLLSDPCQRRQLRDSPSIGDLPPATPWGTLSSGRESQRGLGGLPSSSLSVGTFPLLQPVPGQDEGPGARLCQGGVPVYGCSRLIWSGNCTPHFWHHQARASGGRGRRRVRLARGPAPGWDQPPLLVAATVRPRCLAKAPCRPVPQPGPTGSGSPAKRWVPLAPRLCRLQLLLVEVDALYSSGFGSAWGTHTGRGRGP